MQLSYKLRRQLLVVVALLAVSTGCTKEETLLEQTINEVIHIAKPQQLQELEFENGAGRAIIIFDDGIADCIIYAKGLDPKEEYKISLIGDNGDSPGVMFGPEESVDTRVGSMAGEVIFKPNAEGELYVSMRNPIRIFTAAKKELVFKIESGNKNIIINTPPFLVNK